MTGLVFRLFPDRSAELSGKKLDTELLAPSPAASAWRRTSPAAVRRQSKSVTSLEHVGQGNQGGQGSEAPLAMTEDGPSFDVPPPPEEDEDDEHCMISCELQPIPYAQSLLPVAGPPSPVSLDPFLFRSSSFPLFSFLSLNLSHRHYTLTVYFSRAFAYAHTHTLSLSLTSRPCRLLGRPTLCAQAGRLASIPGDQGLGGRG